MMHLTNKENESPSVHLGVSWLKLYVSADALPASIMQSIPLQIVYDELKKDRSDFLPSVRAADDPEEETLAKKILREIEA